MLRYGYQCPYAHTIEECQEEWKGGQKFFATKRGNTGSMPIERSSCNSDSDGNFKDELKELR